MIRVFSSALSRDAGFIFGETAIYLDAHVSIWMLTMQMFLLGRRELTTSKNENAPALGKAPGRL
jgi:hypothetical protein